MTSEPESHEAPPPHTEPTGVHASTPASAPPTFVYKRTKEGFVVLMSCRDCGSAVRLGTLPEAAYEDARTAHEGLHALAGVASLKQLAAEVSAAQERSAVFAREQNRRRSAGLSENPFKAGDFVLVDGVSPRRLVSRVEVGTVWAQPVDEGGVLMGTSRRFNVDRVSLVE